jgi:hypothetical protein
MLNFKLKNIYNYYPNDPDFIVLNNEDKQIFDITFYTGEVFNIEIYKNESSNVVYIDKDFVFYSHNKSYMMHDISNKPLLYTMNGYYLKTRENYNIYIIVENEDYFYYDTLYNINNKNTTIFDFVEKHINIAYRLKKLKSI